MTDLRSERQGQSAWQNRTYWGEPSFSYESLVFATLPEYAPQHGHIDAGGRLLLDGSAPRNVGGALYVRVPDAAKDLSAGLIAEARSARKVSARRSMIAAGPSTPKPKAEAPASSSNTAARRSTEPGPSPVKPSTSERRGPLNRADFVSPGRQRAIRVRTAQMRGDFLTTGHESPVKPKPRIKLRPCSAAPFAVTIGSRAKREIMRLVQEANGAYECGGSLLGYIGDSAVTVTYALPPGPDAEATPTSIKDRQDPGIIDRIIAEAPGHLVELGSWHSHAWGEGEPSATDQQSLVADQQITGLANPIMLIARPDKTYGWGSPIPVCWALAKSDDPAFDYDVLTVDVRLT